MYVCMYVCKLCMCNIFLTLDGITKLNYKIPQGSSILIGLEINKSLYKLNVPKIARN